MTNEPLDEAQAGESVLEPATIDEILSNFRHWLGSLTTLPDLEDDAPPIDLHTVVSQFTALRHEVNLQTRSARTALEQNAETLQQLSRSLDNLSKPATDATKPLLKGITDVYDALTLALRQAGKQRESFAAMLDELATTLDLPEPPAVPDVATPAMVEQPRGFWSRLFGSKQALPTSPDIAAAIGRQLMLDWRANVLKEAEARQQRVQETAKLTRSSLDGLLAGYQMSINRLDRILEQAGLVPIPTLGLAFDPELMEVVEVVEETGHKAGTVVEELRRGYTREQIVYRFAQVKVAR